MSFRRMVGLKPNRRGLLAGMFAGLMAVSSLFVGPSPAQAQSFFQAIFGIFAPNKPAPKQPSKQSPQPKKIPWVGSKEDVEEVRRSRKNLSPIPKSGNYRTMCVRSCDGYYFPISQGVPSSRFRKDDQVCATRCGGGARLFYLPKNSGDIANMRDLDGNAYEDTKNAFAYRNKLQDGCTCRPMPWSAVEMARHKRYEIFDAYMKIQAKRDAEAEQRAEQKIAALAEKRSRQRQDQNPDVMPFKGAIIDGGVDQTSDQTGLPDRALEHILQDAIGEMNAPLGVVKPQRNVTKQRRIYRTRRFSSDRPRPRKTASGKSTRQKKPAGSMGLGGLFGGGNQKYAWPGDR
ncbi:MAG: DUF2865 domain-containing protein [Pseudomonadota bacterium]